MKKIVIYLTLLLMSFLILTGCASTLKTKTETPSEKNEISSAQNQSSSGTGAPAQNTEAVSQIISATVAKEMMDASKEIIILDVRTEEEYAEGHIKDALLLPYTDIDTKVDELLTDKSVTILIYCRSGRRSAIAAEALNNLGYTSIYDFGGILDWPYEIISKE